MLFTRVNLNKNKTMPQSYYLKIDGVKGESQNQQHKDEIEILSWNCSVNAAPSSPSAAGASGKITVSPITFSHYVDLASPVLLRQCLKGARMPKAVLTVRQDPNSNMDYLRLTFEAIVFTSIVLSAPDNNVHIIETVTMEFTRVKEDYVRIKPDGSTGETISTAYDLLTSQVT